MNILIITDKLYPDEIGGSCTYAYETIIELKKIGHEITIFTCYPNKKENDKYFEGIGIYRYFNKKNPFYSAIQLSKILKNNKFDKVIFHSPISYLIWHLAKTDMFPKQNLIGIYHGPWYKEATLKYRSRKKYINLALVPIMKFIEKLYAKNVKNFVFLSEYMKNELSLIYPLLEKNNRLHVIPGGVKLENYQRKYTKNEARKLLNINKDDFVIFSLRRLEYRMGIQNAIKSLKYIDLNQENKVCYIIGGKGPYERNLREIAKQEEANCRFEGFIPQEKVDIYFCAADIFLVPSIDLEGFGLVILESLAMGLPVVTTPQGGMVDVAKYFDNLFLTEGFDSQSIAKKITEIADYVKSKEFHVEKNISDFDWNVISKRLSNIITKN